MSLAEHKKELEEELEKALEREAKELDAPVEEEKVDETEVKVEEVKEETEPEEKPAEPEKPVEEAKKTPAQYAQERREAVAAARLAKDLEQANAKIQALEASRPASVVNDPEPNKADDPQAWTEWTLRKTQQELAETNKKLSKLDSWTEEQTNRKRVEDLRNQALNEVQSFEAEVRQANPDYDQARSYYANMLAASMKIVNPTMSNEQLVTAVNNRMLSRAAELLNQGHANPVKAMYDEAKNLGFKPQVEGQNDNGKEEKVIKPDLAKVAANRSRNAGTAAAQGDGGKGEITLAYAAGLTNAEFVKLPAADKKRLFGG